MPQTQRQDLDCPEPGIYRDVLNEDYHRWRAVNAGAIKGVSGGTPLSFRHSLDREDTGPTATLMFGSAVHAMLLEPEVFAAAPTIKGLKPNAQAATFARHCKEHGPLVLAEGWMDQFEIIAARLSVISGELPHWRDGDCELCIVWDHETEFGPVRCKARLDWCMEGWLIDVKTARRIDPLGFSRDAYDHGYPLQLWHYTEAYAAAGRMGLDFWPHGVTDTNILCIQNNEPFDVCLYRPTDAWLNSGSRRWLEGLNKLAYCIEMDDWPGVAPDGPLELELPSWVKE